MKSGWKKLSERVAVCAEYFHRPYQKRFYRKPSAVVCDCPTTINISVKMALAKLMIF